MLWKQVATVIYPNQSILSCGYNAKSPLASFQVCFPCLYNREAECLQVEPSSTSGFRI